MSEATPIKTHKKQSEYAEARDRFVAFSFASSDFLLEIDPKGKIVFSAGQSNSLTGAEADQLLGTDWLKIFTDSSQGNIKALLKGVQKAGRLGPLMVDVVNKQNRQKTRALIMGMTIPNKSNIYFTLNTSEAFFDFLAVGDYQDNRLQDGKEFEAAAMKAFLHAKKEEKNLDVTFVEAQQIEDYKKSLTFAESRNFMENFQALLKEQSLEGNAATQIDNSKYAVIHDTSITPEYIEQKIQDLVNRTGAGELEVGLKTQTVEADMMTLNEREARRALIYTMRQVEKGGLDKVGTDLKDSFDEYLHENARKITRLKELVGQQAFKLNFQPIVHLPSEELCHYEALVRFASDESPYELIVFGEDIGIAPDIDMAILRQAAGYITRAKRFAPDIRIAVNISGQSIQSQSFFDKMMHMIEELECSPDNLMFEITESTAIGDLELVNGYIQQLRDQKFEVCLDDFGAGAASFQYLNGLDIDCVKIDGKYIRDALNSSRDEAMVRNLARMCQDLGVTTIAEMVETQEQLDYLTSIGVDKAQGWIFGKPAPKAEYMKRVK